MARRRERDPRGESVRPNMTPMIDIVFQLITFFVMLMTIAKDEAAQKVRLPKATTAAVLQDDQIPDSLNVNVAFLDDRPMLLSWGLELDLADESSWNVFTIKIRNESALQKDRQRQRGSDWKKDGLSTTIIVRVDVDVEYSVFRRIIDVCRQAGFTKFQLKARGEEEDGGAST